MLKMFEVLHFMFVEENILIFNVPGVHESVNEWGQLDVKSDTFPGKKNN